MEFETGNDVPEILGDDNAVDGVREELELGMEIIGPDILLTVPM